MDSTSQMVPVYKWMQALKKEVMHKLSKHNIQSLDPLFQLTQVHHDVWYLALKLSHPVKTIKGRSHKLKPLTSITTFQLLAGLSDNEKLQLLSTLYKGDLDIRKVEARAHELKVCKQVEATFVADAGMPVMEITRLLGEDIYCKEVECWMNTFSQLSKGRSLHPENFTMVLVPVLIISEVQAIQEVNANCGNNFHLACTADPSKHLCSTKCQITSSF